MGRRIARQRGQMTLLGLIAIALVVLLIVGVFLYRGRTEREVRVGRISSESTREMLIKLERQVDTLLATSMYEAAFEMGAHGGYIAESVPRLNHYGVPYLFYRGKVVNLPSVKAMQEMYADEVKRRLETKLVVLRRELEGKVVLAVPEVRITLVDDNVLAKMELPVEVQGETRARSRIPISMNLPVRLKRLRDLAERYVRDYTRERRMEKNFLYGMTNDPRIATPGSDLRTIPCEGKTVLSTYNQLVTPFRETAQLAVSLELKRVLESPIYSSEHIQWDVDLNPREVEFSFVANQGEGTYESTDTIRLIPVPFPAVAQSDGLCLSRFFVQYDINFPMRYTIRDVQPTSMTIGATENLAVRPLDFRFYMMPLLLGEDVNAVDVEVTAPETVDDLCHGSCSVDLTITNSDAGTVWLDSCKYRYSGGRLQETGTVCGRLTLIVEPDAQFSLAKYVEQVTIIDNIRSLITLKPFSTVTGSMMEKRRVYCSTLMTVREDPSVPLGAQEGTTPGTVEVILQPLSSRLDRRRVSVDESGAFEIPFVVPGRYLVMAVPSRNEAGVPYQEVESAGFIHEVTEGRNELTIELEPLGLMKVGDKYIGITSTEVC